MGGSGSRCLCSSVGICLLANVLRSFTSLLVPLFLSTVGGGGSRGRGSSCRSAFLSHLYFQSYCVKSNHFPHFADKTDNQGRQMLCLGPQDNTKQLEFHGSGKQRTGQVFPLPGARRPHSVLWSFTPSERRVTSCQAPEVSRCMFMRRGFKEMDLFLHKLEKTVMFSALDFTSSTSPSKKRVAT